MSYTITRTNREVRYERDLDDRIDMYLYFNERGRHINGDQGIQPEHLLSELIEFIKTTMVSSVKGGPTQQAQALDLVLTHLGSAQEILDNFRSRELMLDRIEYTRSKK